MAFSTHLFKLFGYFIAATLLFACQKQPAQPSFYPLNVQLMWQNQPLNCQQSLPISANAMRMSQLQFYLADFQLNGATQPLIKNDWQQENIALLGTDCQSEGHWQLHFAQPLNSGELSFTVGVPFAQNHQNPLQAQTPLQQSDMHWSWQQGYKFFRLDLQGADFGWSLHLGSTGCNSASVMRAPNQPCAAPNRPLIHLNFQAGQRLILDLAPLFQEFTPTANNHCMADPNQLSCQQLLPILAVTPSEPAQTQQVWRTAL